MEILGFVLVFLFGLIVGSFLNVVILRMDTGRGVMGRSGCFSCGKTLAWYELIPLVSFFTLQGKCSGCKSKISFQYPLVEFSTGSLFLLVYLHEAFRLTFELSDLFLLILSLGVWSTLVVIFVYDLRHMIIPGILSATFGGLALVRAGILVYYGGVSVAVSHTLAVVFLAGFLGALWYFSKGTWMGYGDVEFAVGMGLFLGLPVAVSAFAFSFWIGAAVMLSIMFYKKSVGTSRLREGGKEITMKSEIPFAPFLIAGMGVAWYFQADLFHLSSFFS